MVDALVVAAAFVAALRFLPGLLLRSLRPRNRVRVRVTAGPGVWFWGVVAAAVLLGFALLGRS